jgi:hypothetical protein
MNDPAPVKKSVVRLLDLLPLTVVAAATLYFVGWSYRQSYYGQFALDPASLGGTNIAIAVEGVNALVQMLWQWIKAMQWLMIATVVMLLVVTIVERLRARRAGSTEATTAKTSVSGWTSRPMWIALAAFGSLFVGLSGQLAGRWHARDRVENVRRGETWSYHLSRETIDGVTIAQAGELTWVLTCSGMRPLRTGDIQRIDGPLFQRVMIRGSAPRGGGCTVPSPFVAR